MAGLAVSQSGPGFAKQPARPEGGLGCLVTKSINERTLIDEQTFERIEAALIATESQFLDNLLPDFPQKKADRLARFLTSTLQGITTMSRLDPDSSRLKDVVATLGVLLDAEATHTAK